MAHSGTRPYSGFEKGAIELMEEAVQLLRRSPASVAKYYIGSLPFVLAFLYYWADMSRSAFAYNHVVEASLALSVLFIWMKCWQSLFVITLQSELSGGTPIPLSWARIWRLIFVQTIFQPSGLFLIPAAFFIFLPFGWVYAFYQNVTLLGDGRTIDLRKIWDEAWKHARMWQGRNHVLLLLFAVLSFVLFLNITILVLFVPGLLSTLAGVETIFTRSGVHVLNTTLLAVAFGGTYLCLDPLVKVCYLLRCFYAASVATGADIVAELRAVTVSHRAAILLCLFLLYAGSRTSFADHAISPEKLNNAIAQEIKHPEYQWRMPREVQQSHGLLPDFFQGLANATRKLLKPIIKWMREVIEWIDRQLLRSATGERDQGPRLINQRNLIIALIALAVGLLAILLWRMRHKKSQTEMAELHPVLSVPDLADENVSAAELPEEGWESMARDFLQSGELRLALRAFYLACLAHLARRELITLAKFKSNRDYQLEVGRRSHARPQLLEVFSENVSSFERAWYGMHEVTNETISHFGSNQERLKGLAEA